jgi:hypothetical protein
VKAFSAAETRLLLASQMEAATVIEDVLGKFADGCWRVYDETPKWRWILRRRLYTRYAFVMQFLAVAIKFGQDQEPPS